MKKSFKNSGAEAVNKFFSKDTLNDVHSTQDTQIKQNTHQEPQTQNTSILNKYSKKERVQSKPRINMSFHESALFYLNIMSRLDGVSITTYVNNLVSVDQKNRDLDYKKAIELFTDIISKK
jgi:hypothetical protein